MRMMFDTGAVMNSSILSYHLWAILEYLEIVGEFIQCGDNTGYDFVQLITALDLDPNKQPLDHGKMTAVIHYRTPYLVKNRDHMFISFSLGDDVSLRCVIGLPILLSLGGLINLIKGTFSCSELNCPFHLNLDPMGSGLTAEVEFDNTIPTIPVGVSTNFHPNPSFLHYTSTEVRALSLVRPSVIRSNSSCMINSLGNIFTVI